MYDSKKYYRVMLGTGSKHAKLCLDENFIGVYFEIQSDLSEELEVGEGAFKEKWRNIYLQNNPDKTKISAGLACGSLWTFCKDMRQGNMVLCPDGQNIFHLGEITGDYYYQEGGILPHRRRVKWLDKTVSRYDLSESMQRSVLSGTISDITQYEVEIRALFHEGEVTLKASDESIEDPNAFVMEKHLEDFLIENWSSCDLSKDYDIYEDGGELIGRQYPTDTGRIDILAISKDKKELLVIELKKGKASDATVGQVLRYMGYLEDEMAEEGQSVCGCIIALGDDTRIKRALQTVPNVKFYRYEVKFKLRTD